MNSVLFKDQMNTPHTVALYWDFENIHAGVYEKVYGPGEYAKSPRPRDIVVNVQAIVDYAASYGVLSVNKAYCNWQWFSRYREDLLRGSVELVQIYPPGSSAKNGADIKLSLDALEDSLRFQHISTVIVVGGDSDFLPLAQKIKAVGKQLVGIGCLNNTNRFWANTCTRFSYYEEIISANLDDTGVQNDQQETDGTETPPSTLFVETDRKTEAAQIVVEAIAWLRRAHSVDAVNKATIIPAIKRSYPSFQLHEFGYRDLSHLLNDHPDKFLVTKGHPDHTITLRTVEEAD
jgi:hypothetical protein